MYWCMTALTKNTEGAFITWKKEVPPLERNHKRAKMQQSDREGKPRKRGGIIRKFFFGLFTLILIGICTACMVAGIFMKYVDTTLTPALQVDADDYTMKLSSIVYYQDRETGNWVEYQTVHGRENRIWVDFKQMPDALWQAAVAIEDERFFQHEGVDWKRTAGATVNMFIGMRDTFGGSTITQQMLKNMTGDNKPYVNRKVREIFRALEFEKNYTKEQILELYLNMIYLGQGCYGVQTAAQFYFGKDVSELSVAECASLIAITNNPSLYGPMYDVTYTKDDGTTVTPRELNKKRQLNILKKMSEVGKEGTVEDGKEPFITKEVYEAAKAEELKFTDGSTDAEDIVEKATGGIEIDSWFIDEVIRDVRDDLAEKYDISAEEALLRIYNSGYNIYTTLDPKIQEIAESVYEDRSNLDLTSRDGQPIRSGITIIDPYTGNIVATVGDMGPKEGNLLLNYATDRRQVGSSIKPLTVYAPAIEAGAVTPATTFDDYPVRLEGDPPSPWPHNSPDTYKGWTTVTDGIRRSVNTIAVQTLQSVGTVNAFAFATENLRLGLVSADMDESPLGMGGLTYGLNTVEMAAAYAAFANNGIYNSPRTYVQVTDADGNVILENESESHVAMSETTAYLMNKMLVNAVNAGTGTQAKFKGMTIAGKTGTTSNNFDRYFVGYTPHYVAAVWTGYKYSAKISYSGGNPAITMWKLVMEQIHEGLENKSFAKPSSGLEKVTVCADSGLLCTDACYADVRGTSRAIEMEVAEGTAPTETCTLHVFKDYCTEGQCLATENCPAECVTQVGVLNHVRVDYNTVAAEGAEETAEAEIITAEDDPYLLINMEKAIGLQPTIAADGTEIYPEVIGCTVHTTSSIWPGFDWPWLDPSDPNYIPPDSGWVEPEGETGGETDEPDSDIPIMPTEPAEPDPTDPAGGDWWSEFWNA